MIGFRQGISLKRKLLQGNPFLMLGEWNQLLSIFERTIDPEKMLHDMERDARKALNRAKNWLENEADLFAERIRKQRMTGDRPAEMIDLMTRLGGVRHGAARKWHKLKHNIEAWRRIQREWLEIPASYLYKHFKGLISTGIGMDEASGEALQRHHQIMVKRRLPWSPEGKRIQQEFVVLERGTGRGSWAFHYKGFSPLPQERRMPSGLELRTDVDL